MKRDEWLDELSEYEQGKRWKVTAPIAIPSYKNRKGIILQNPEAFGDAQVYVFCYDFDYTESGYDKLNLPDNFHIVQIHPDGWRNWQQKVRWIRFWMRDHGFDMYFQLDDDILPKWRITNADPNDTRSTKTIPLYDALAMWQAYSDNHGLKFTTPAYNIQIPFVKTKADMTRTDVELTIGFYMSIKELESHDVWFQEDPEVYDIMFSSDLMNADIHPVMLNFICKSTMPQGTDTGGSPSSMHKVRVIKTYMRGKGHSRFKLFKNGRLGVGSCGKIDKYYNVMSKYIQGMMDNNKSYEEIFDEVSDIMYKKKPFDFDSTSTLNSFIQ